MDPEPALRVSPPSGRSPGRADASPLDRRAGGPGTLGTIAVIMGDDTPATGPPWTDPQVDMTAAVHVLQAQLADLRDALEELRGFAVAGLLGDPPTADGSALPLSPALLMAQIQGALGILAQRQAAPNSGALPPPPPPPQPPTAPPPPHATPLAPVPEAAVAWHALFQEQRLVTAAFQEHTRASQARQARWDNIVRLKRELGRALSQWPDEGET
ncbi:hypothetical protein PAPYR_1181 [Paratrimastix pyriformis]|uniref:Uncharacterized protein n=1 Tax=Paratrimastix pyriformis TaxID=342808 RepID=A0ABQ8UXC0_9EUKA|nr:hypothetical protein PAPYR_1181 [Paratrimastix pyriformis]